MRRSKNFNGYSIEYCATRMGVSPQFLRVALQQEKLPFGIAVKNKQYTYHINPEAFENYMKGG